MGVANIRRHRTHATMKSTCSNSIVYTGNISWRKSWFSIKTLNPKTILQTSVQSLTFRVAANGVQDPHRHWLTKNYRHTLTPLVFENISLYNNPGITAQHSTSSSSDLPVILSGFISVFALYHRHQLRRTLDRRIFTILFFPETATLRPPNRRNASKEGRSA